MNETELLALFRSTLKASLAVPLVVTAVACGGQTGGTSLDGGGNADSGRHDAAVGQDAGECLIAECGACNAGCVGTNSCVDGVFTCGCICSDAATVDSSTPDAPVDPCHQPAPTLCSGIVVPETCFPSPPVSDAGAAAFVASLCTEFCTTDAGVAASSCELQDSDAGTQELKCSTPCAVGRAFEGMAAAPSLDVGNAIGAHFAEMAYLEAAAVDAFRILRAELVAHGAPQDLVDDAARAEADEVRHARITGTLARRFGADATNPAVGARPVRPLAAVALENAVEGCVKETFGALLAHHQAATALDGRVRRVMEAIAPDETRHAALAWKIAAWAEARLTGEERAQVREAQRKAIDALRASLMTEPGRALRAVAGLPDAQVGRRMVAALEAKLWS